MRDILALEGKRSPPAAIQLLSCALFNSAMPCTGMIGLSVSLHGISLHACAACVVCLCVSVCARATCGCALRARGFLCSSVLYLYSCTCIVFLKCRYIGAFTFFLVFTTLPQVLLVASSIAYFRVATEAGIRPTRRADVLLWYIKP